MPDYTNFFPRSWKLYEAKQCWIYNPLDEDWGDEIWHGHIQRTKYDTKTKMGISLVNGKDHLQDDAPWELWVPSHFCFLTQTDVKAARLIQRKWQKKPFKLNQTVTVAWPDHPDYFDFGPVEARVMKKINGGLQVKYPNGAYDVIPWLVLERTPDNLAAMAQKKQQDAEQDSQHEKMLEKQKKEQQEAVKKQEEEQVKEVKKTEKELSSYESRGWEVGDLFCDENKYIYLIRKLPTKTNQYILAYDFTDDTDLEEQFTIGDIRKINHSLDTENILTTSHFILHEGASYIVGHRMWIPLQTLQLEFGPGWVKFTPKDGIGSPYKVPTAKYLTELDKYPDDEMPKVVSQVDKPPPLKAEEKKHADAILNKEHLKSNAPGDTSAKSKRIACSNATNETLTKIGQATGHNIKALNDSITSSWSGSSSTGRCKVASAMKAVGLLHNMNDFTKEECANSKVDMENSPAEWQAWLRARWHITQKYLRELRPDDKVIELYRGIGYKEAAPYAGITGEALYFPNPAQSWTVSIPSARKFGSTIVCATFPIDMVLFSYVDTQALWQGFAKEREYVLMFPGKEPITVKVIHVD